MKTAALVAASDFNESAFLSEHASHPYTEVVAVDAGYAHLQATGVAPTFALGDFDSLGYVPQDVPLITFPEEKDDSDLGLALDWCSQQGFDRVTVYGAFAGRLDHTLSALQTMTRFALETGRPIEGISQGQRLVFLPKNWSLSFSAADQTEAFCAQSKDVRTVSVIAQTNQVEGLTILGLKYVLEKGSLSNTISLGLSNELVGKEARISLESGCALVIAPLCIGVGLSGAEI